MNFIMYFTNQNYQIHLISCYCNFEFNHYLQNHQMPITNFRDYHLNLYFTWEHLFIHLIFTENLIHFVNCCFTQNFQMDLDHCFVQMKILIIYCCRLIHFKLLDLNSNLHIYR